PWREIRRREAIALSAPERGMHSVAWSVRDWKSYIPNLLRQMKHLGEQPRFRQRDLSRVRSSLRNCARALRRRQKQESLRVLRAAPEANRSDFFCVLSKVPRASPFLGGQRGDAQRDRFHQRSRPVVDPPLQLQRAYRDE